MKGKKSEERKGKRCRDGVGREGKVRKREELKNGEVKALDGKGEEKGVRKRDKEDTKERIGKKGKEKE